MILHLCSREQVLVQVLVQVLAQVLVLASAPEKGPAQVRGRCAPLGKMP